LSQPLLNRAPSRSTIARPSASVARGFNSQAYLLGVWILLAVFTPAVGFGGARGFAPLVGFCGLLCLPLARPRTVEVGGLILFALLLEWALISAFWSPAPYPHTLKDFRRFTGLHLAQQVLFCGALIITARTLTPRVAGKALTWLGGGLMVLAAVLLFESLTDALLFRTGQRLLGQETHIAHWALRNVAQGGYALAVLFWPTVLALHAAGRRRLMILFAALCLADVVLLHVAALAMALLVSAAVFALVLWRGRIAALACAAVAVLQTLLIPWLMLGLAEGGLFQSLRARLPASWAARVDIWSYTSTLMAQKPVFGWGLDASRMFKGHIPLHPHDGPLQLWFELGLPGAVLGAVVLGFVFWRFAEAAPRQPRVAAAGCAVGAASLTIAAFSFGLWQEWWICLMALAFAACVVLGRQLDQEVAP
jgi:O-antigen ligase